MIIKSYTNVKKELEIIKLRLIVINENKQHLQTEENSLKELSLKLDDNIKIIEKSLKELTGIEYKLYSKIVIDGFNVTRAIDKISFEEDRDESTLWKNYYPKVKKEIDLLKKI